MIGLLFVLGLVAWFAFIGFSHLVDVEDPRVGLLARCEHEHRLLMSGDEQAIYGQFPPADLS